MSGHALAIGVLQAEIVKLRERFATAIKSANYHCSQWEKDTAEAKRLEGNIATLEASLLAVITIDDEKAA